MKKTKFSSYSLNGISEGCKLCVRGEKSVLFIGGRCSRNCWYCSLSDFRKKTNKIFINERPVKKIKEIIEEIKESNSNGVGVTGGDPLINLNKTLKILRELRKNFGKKFHIHIYLPLNLVREKKLRKLSFYVDEVRFHPSIFLKKDEKVINDEIEKIKKASMIFNKKIGIELPCLPNKEKAIISFIQKIEDFISFVNINEFEISETNQKKIENKFKLNKDTYTIKNSLETGKKILKYLEKKKTKLRVHLCSAETKDLYQLRNRFLRRKILPFGKRLKNGNVVYFVVFENPKENIKKIRGITKNIFFDKERKRILIKMEDVSEVYEKTDLKIARVEEQPVFGNEIIEIQWIEK